MRLPDILVLLAATLATGAWAAPGDFCSTVDSATYGVDSTRHCVLLADGISDAGNETEGKPTTAINFQPFDYCTFSISKAQTSCEPGSIFIEESTAFASASPVVWSTITTLTGVVSPLVSSVTLMRRPRTWVRARLAAITDADCTDVDVVVECRTFSK